MARSTNEFEYKLEYKEPYTVNFFTKDELNELKNHKDFIFSDDLPQEIIDENKDKISDELMKVYTRKQQTYATKCDNEFCKQYDKNMKKMLKEEDLAVKFFDDIGKYEKIKHPELGELDFLVLPAGTKMYKGVHYFYDTLPSDHFWVGAKSIAMSYTFINHGGLNVYKPDNELKLFVLNKDNMKKIYDKCESPEMQGFLKLVYSCGITLMEHLEQYRLRNKFRIDTVPIFNKHRTVREKCERFEYIHTTKPTRIIHTYLYDKYKFQGTFLPYYMTAYESYGLNEEINLNIKECPFIKLDETDPLYWKNWGITVPPIKEFVLNESYNNRGGIALDWYYKPVNTDIQEKEMYKIRILSYNVRNFASANVLDYKRKTFDNFMKLVEKINPNIIILQDFDPEYYVHMPNKYKKQAPNGKAGSTLAVFTDHPSFFEVIKFRGINERDSIMINYKYIKILATNLEVGKDYWNGYHYFYRPSAFSKVYESNYKMREEQIKELLALTPDIVVGDMNFTPEDDEMKLFEAAEYSCEKELSTTIYGAKMDFVFSNKKIKGREYVLDYYKSDHKPLVYDFNIERERRFPKENIDERTVNGGMISQEAQIVLIISFIIILLLLVIFFVTDYKQCNYIVDKLVKWIY